MRHIRAANRTARPFTILTVTALLLAAAPLVHPLAALAALAALGAPGKAAGTWTDQAPSAAPSARASHAMAPLGGGRVLLFGGWDTSFLNDTWVYDLSMNTWISQAPAPAPSARHKHAMAAIGEDQALLFGGGDDANRYGDTWLAAGFYETSYRTCLPAVMRNRRGD